MEATGRFRTPDSLAPHLEAAPGVLVAAPVKKAPALDVVYGCNHRLYDPARHRILSAASCTTNCLAPLVKVVHETFGIRHGSMTTIHDVTNTQVVVDAPHKDLRRARSALNALIPTSTGSATAIAEIYPALKGRLNGHAVRVPLLNASLTDCAFELETATDAETVNAAFRAAAAEGDLARGIESYRAVVGRKPVALNAAKAIKLPATSLDGAKALALRTHPDLKRVQHQVSASELGILVAEAGKRPQLKITSNIGVSDTFNSANGGESASLGLSASQPIYQGGRLSALERKARAQRDSARADLHIGQLQIAQNVGNAWAQLNVARATSAASTEQVSAAQVAFRGVREEATLGARTTLDVLDAEQELLDARASLVSAQIDEVRAGYMLLATMGLLTAERLNLNVPRYDPAAYYNLVKTAPTSSSKQGKQLDRVLKSLGKE